MCGSNRVSVHFDACKHVESKDLKLLDNYCRLIGVIVFVEELQMFEVVIH